MGETAARILPWPSGKDSNGNRLGIGFLWWFLLPLSLAAKKAARRRQLNVSIGRSDPWYCPRRGPQRKAVRSAGKAEENAGFILLSG